MTTPEMTGAEPRNPTEALDVQRNMAETLAGQRPVNEAKYPYFPPDYKIPFLHIGTERQLFLDNFMLDHLEGVQRVFPKPQRSTESLVKQHELPWEIKGDPLPEAAFYDPEDKKFKLWYVEGLTDDPYGDRGMVMCYAESTDCRHWEKPLSTNGIPFKEHQATNIVLEDAGHHIMLVRNPDASDLQRKYWLVYNPGGKARDRGKRVMSSMAASPDGWRWTVESEDTPFRHHHLSRAIWDESIQQWIAYSQYSHHWNLVYRTRQIGRQESPDFVHWSPKEVVLSADWDPNVAPEVEFHDMSVRKIGGQYIGIMTEFVTDPIWCVRNDGNWRDFAYARFALYASRDGKRWQRVGSPAEPWVDNGPPGSLDYGFLNFTLAGQLVHEGKTIILHGAISVKQNWFGRTPPTPMVPEANYRAGKEAWDALQQKSPTALRKQRGVGALTLREDGWAELKPAYEHGKVYTKQFVFEGDRLNVNADCYGGYLQVEIVDPNFQPYPGFSAQDCDPVFADDPRQIWHTVRWQGNADVRSLWNKPCRLIFHLHQASLYSFQFVEGG